MHIVAAPPPERAGPAVAGRLANAVRPAILQDAAASRHADTTRAPARHTIAILHVHQILLGARRLGFDTDGLLRRARISPTLLASGNARVTQAQYAALMRSLRRVTRDELWGLLERPVRPGVFAHVCRALIHCGTLEAAMTTGLAQYRLHLQGFTPRLRRSPCGRSASLVLIPDAPPTPCQRFAESTFVFHAYGLANWLVARSLPLTGVDLAAPAPPRQTDTERIFNTVVRYGQPRTALHFDAANLHLPVVQDATSLAAFLRDAPRNLIVRYRGDSCLAQRIRQHLRAHLDDELPSLEQTAQALRLTPQTLRRRLRDEGRGYQSIKDNLRRDAAIGLLERSSLPLQEVALRLGFSEPSAFHRAFKKWTGVAPGEYRQRGRLPGGLAMPA